MLAGAVIGLFMGYVLMATAHAVRCCWALLGAAGRSVAATRQKCALTAAGRWAPMRAPSPLSPHPLSLARDGAEQQHDVAADAWAAPPLARAPPLSHAALSHTHARAPTGRCLRPPSRATRRSPSFWATRRREAAIAAEL
jgi:hypothetical protein